MMVLKIFATVVYNIVLWGGLLSYITFEINWSIAALLLYPVCMPIFFHVVYFVIFPKEEMEQKWRVYQVFMQIMITVFCAVIMTLHIEARFGTYEGLMSSVGDEYIRAFIIGICSTTSFIFARIVSAFWE